MLKKKLISLTSAIVLVLSLFTLLPEGTLKAVAASKLNIRTSFNINTGKLTITWDPYSSNCSYAIHYYNEVAEGPNQGQFLEMPELSVSYPNMNSTTYTTSDGFGQAYGNGGKKYKIKIVCGDGAYSEFSDPFETNTTILPTPQNPTICENGLVFWNDESTGYTSIDLFNFKTNERVFHSETTRKFNSYLPGDLKQGEYYYAVIQNIARGNYLYRYSKKVTTNVAQYKGKTDVLGSYWEGTKLCWIRYPDAVNYSLDMQISSSAGLYTTVTTGILSDSLTTYTEGALIKVEMKDLINKFNPGVKIRFTITALDANGNAISNPTTTAPTLYKRLVGDVNLDDVITADDSIIVARYAANFSNYKDKYNKNLCDMNRDGKVTADDAIIIARYAADYTGYKERYTHYV